MKKELNKLIKEGYLIIKNTPQAWEVLRGLGVEDDFVSKWYKYYPQVMTAEYTFTIRADSENIYIQKKEGGLYAIYDMIKDLDEVLSMIDEIAEEQATPEAHLIEVGAIRERVKAFLNELSTYLYTGDRRVLQ